MAFGRDLARGLYRISGPDFPPLKSNLGGSPQLTEQRLSLVLGTYMP